MPMFAMSLALAGTQIMQGISASREAKYNAKIYEQQAGMIEASKGMENRRYDRLKRKVQGQTISRIAGSGIELGGSPLAVLIDNLTEVEMDRASEMYNLDVQKHSALSQRQLYKSKASTAMMSGYSNAFGTTLKGGYTYGVKKGWVT